MTRTKSIVRCNPEILKLRMEVADLGSANALAVAAKVDPKTARAMLAGDEVNIAKVRQVAMHLAVPLKDVLLEEFWDTVEAGRSTLDLTDEKIFPVDLDASTGKSRLAVASISALPVDAPRMIDLIQRSEISPPYYNTEDDIFEQRPVNPLPVWSLGEGVQGTGDVINALTDLDAALKKSQGTGARFALSGLIETLEVRNELQKHIDELRKRHRLHVLAAELKTAALQFRHEESYWVEVRIPIFILASSDFKEVKVRYQYRMTHQQAIKHDQAVPDFDDDDPPF